MSDNDPKTVDLPGATCASCSFFLPRSPLDGECRERSPQAKPMTYEAVFPIVNQGMAACGQWDNRAFDFQPEMRPANDGRFELKAVD